AAFSRVSVLGGEGCSPAAAGHGLEAARCSVACGGGPAGAHPDGAIRDASATWHFGRGERGPEPEGCGRARRTASGESSVGRSLDGHVCLGAVRFPRGGAVPTSAHVSAATSPTRAPVSARVTKNGYQPGFSLF